MVTAVLKLLPCFSALGLAALIVLLPRYVVAQPKQEQVAQINSYVAQVDRFIKLTPKSLRIFANVAAIDATGAQWKEFRNEEEREKADTGDNLNENAYVWTKDRNVIGVNFTFDSPSGDWAHFVMYYFRDDGSLAKIQAQLNTFYGDVSIVRSLYFDKRGTVLRSTRRYLDLKTRKPIKKPGDVFDHSVPIYRNVQALAFQKLL